MLPGCQSPASARPQAQGHGTDVPASAYQADRELRDRLCSGAPAAVHELLELRCGAMLGFLAFKFGFEDLKGELLLHLQVDQWRRLRTWKGESSLKTWVETVATRICLRRVKERRRFVPLEEWNELEVAVNRDRNEQEGMLARRDLLKAMALLPSDQERRLLALHALQGLPLAEVAQLMGITRGNADVIKHRAVKHMRQALGLEGQTNG